MVFSEEETQCSGAGRPLGEGKGSRFVRRIAPEPGGAPGRPPSGDFLAGIGRLPLATKGCNKTSRGSDRVKDGFRLPCIWSS